MTKEELAWNNWMHIGKSQSNEQEAVVRPSISQYSDTSVGAGVGPSQTVGQVWDAAAGCWRRRRLVSARLQLHPPPVPLSHVLPGHGEG